MSESPRAVDVFLKYLRAEKVDTVFGVVGGLAYPLFEAIELSDDIRFVMSRHEEGAAFMADGYARVGRRIGVCIGTAGPGSTNLLTGVACAFADAVPLLVITGQVATHAHGRGAAQETTREDMDIVAMFGPVTKYSAMVTDATSLPRHIRRALRLATNGRPGPVHLNIPVNIWEQKLDEHWFDPNTYRPTTHGFDRIAVQKAAELLLSAKNPVFLVGSGVAISNAEQHLAALATLMNARVATSPRAKGVFPEDDPNSLGVLGVAGHTGARELILGNAVDVLFVIGASLNETTTFNWHPGIKPSRGLIQLDIDAERLGRNYPVDVALVGDAQAVLVELVYHAHRRIRDGHVPSSEWSLWSTNADDTRYEDIAGRKSEQTPLHPARWRAELEELLPDDAVVFSDIGGHMLFNIHHLRIRRRQRFIINLGFGSMGHGTVAPMGAAFADPTRSVFAIIGDGCFQMNGTELLTAVEHDLRIVWIVESNQMHGITWHCSKVLSNGRGLKAAKYLKPVAIAAIARAMGLASFIVDGPGQMRAAMAAALEVNGPSLIEVRVDPEIVPPIGERAGSLAGFIER